MKKPASVISIAAILIFIIALVPVLPAHAATVSATIYSSDTGDEAFKDFALPSNAGNIQISVNTGSVLQHGWNANGTYRVRVGGGSVTTTQILAKDVDVEKVNIRTQTLNSAGVLLSTTYSWDNSDNHPTIQYSQNGYTGTLAKWVFTTAAGITYQSGSNTCKETIYTGFYKGQVFKQATVYSYTITITYDTSGGGPVTPPPPTETPHIPVTQQTYTIVNGETLLVPVRAVNVSDFNGLTFTVTYETAKLQLDTLTYYTADGAAITLVSHNTGTGVITFSCDKAIPLGETWTGIVVVVAFTALANGDATVGVAVS